jgi:hypothetical protein
MHMVRNTLLILFAAFIDLLQAGTSAALFVIGAFPVTTVGGTAGCLIGKYVGGSLGCAILGTVAGVVGAPANAPVAVTTLPLAIGLGVAVNFCLDITLGLVLTLFLLWFGMYKKGYGVGGFLVELIPGIDNIPGWTIMTALCVVSKTAEEKKLKAPGETMFKSLMVTAGAGALAAFKINQVTQRVARERGISTQEEQGQRLEEKKQFVSTELKNIDGIRAKNNATYAA